MNKRIRTWGLALLLTATSVGIPLAAAATDQPVPAFSDVPPDHWAAQALNELATKYKFKLGFPDQTYKGDLALTRYQMAALLAQVLQQVKEMKLESGDAAGLKKLVDEFRQELERWQQEHQEEIEVIKDQIDLLQMAVEQQQESFFAHLMNSLPFAFSGDIAVRHELVSSELGDFSKAISNTPQSRFTLSLQSRNEGIFSYGARMTVGNPRNATNTWWRLGDYFAKVELSLDRFFIKYKPVQFLEFTAGKYRNPFSNSEIFYDADINLEGAMQKLIFTNVSPVLRDISLSLGETVINMNTTFGHTFMLSAKADSHWALGDTIDLAVNVGYHHFVGEQNILQANQTATALNQPARLVGNFPRTVSSNTGSPFSLLNGFGKVTFKFSDRFPLDVSVDYLRNMAAPSQNQAVQVSGLLGNTQQIGHFFLGYNFKYLEADATVSALVEDQLGNTNIMAHEGLAGVKVWDNTTLFATVQAANSLTNPTEPLWTIRTGVHQRF